MTPAPSIRRTRRILRDLARDVGVVERTLGDATWYDDPETTAGQARPHVRDIATRDTAEPADTGHRVAAGLAQLAAARGLTVARVAHLAPLAPDLHVWRAGDTLCVWASASRTTMVWGMAVALLADDVLRASRGDPPAREEDVAARLAAHTLLTECGLTGLPTPYVLAFMGVAPDAVVVAAATVAPRVAEVRGHLAAATTLGPRG